MKNRILDHLGMKIISLVIAILIWVIVANVDDYKTTRQITGIEIDFINGHVITERNKVYEVPEGTTIDIIVKGRRKVVENLSNLDFKAVADLSKMSITNAVTVEVSTINSTMAKELSISYSNNNVLVVVENKIEKQLPINVRTSSQVKAGMAIRSKSATPNLITVAGAEGIVNAIDSAVIDVDVTGASQSIMMYGAPVFLDRDGKVIDSSKFEFDIKQVEVFLEILPTKELDVVLKTTGEPKGGYAISSLDYQPTSIQVVGDAKDLAMVDEIIIDDLDVSDLDKDMETSIDILDYLPDGITLANDNSEIMVKVIVEKVSEKTIYLDHDDINIVGKREEFSYAITAIDKYALKVHGLEENLKNLKTYNLLPSINVSEYGVGTYHLVVNLRNIEGIEVDDSVVVQLEIVQKEE